MCLKKNQSTPRPSEHPPVMGGKMSLYVLCVQRPNIRSLGAGRSVKIRSHKITKIKGKEKIERVLVAHRLHYCQHGCGMRPEISHDNACRKGYKNGDRSLGAVKYSPPCRGADQSGHTVNFEDKSGHPVKMLTIVSLTCRRQCNAFGERGGCRVLSTPYVYTFSTKK